MYVNRTTRSGSANGNKQKFVNMTVVSAVRTAFPTEAYPLHSGDRSESLVPMSSSSLRPRLFGKVQCMIAGKPRTVYGGCVLMKITELLTPDSFIAQDPLKSDSQIKVTILKHPEAEATDFDLEWLEVDALFVGLLCDYTLASGGGGVEAMILSLLQQVPATISTESAIRMWKGDLTTLENFTLPSVKRLLPDEAHEEMRTPEKKKRCTSLTSSSSSASPGTSA